MAKRTDPHRPGAIIPAHYAPVLAYNCATSQDGWPVPSWNIICERYDARLKLNVGKECTADCAASCVCASKRAHEAGCAVFGSPGKCGSCGAWFVYGELWRHDLTGDLVHLGHDCALKYGLMMDRSAAELANGRARAAVATQIHRAERAEERAAFLAANPGLAEAFEVGDAQSVDRAPQIIADIAARFVEFAQLSEKQIALVLRLADEIKNPKPVAPEDVHVPAPFGKGVTFEGVITSAKLRTSDWGTSWKISIKVAAEGGSWIAWGSAPAGVVEHAVAIADDHLATHNRGRDNRADLIRGALIGMHVEVKATLEKPRPREIPSDGATPEEIEQLRRKNAETHFAFMIRPSGYVVKYDHPVKGTRRLAAERAYEKAIHEERSAMLAIGGSHFGKYVVQHDDVVASLAAKGTTLDTFLAAKPTRRTRKTAPATIAEAA
jgi:hypothetical protein